MVLHSYGLRGGINHALTAYTEHFSVVILPEVFVESKLDKPYKLSETEDEFVEKGFKDCLGQVCEDIKIWTFTEEYVSEEAAQAGLSYLLSNGSELLYSIYLHGDLTNDYLLINFPIPSEIVADCYSIAAGHSIEY
jgi:hypothetical protein